MGNFGTIEEGPVTIEFTKTGSDRLKFSVTVDFAKTDCSSNEAGGLFNAIVQHLRSSLGVKLSKCK